MEDRGKAVAVVGDLFFRSKIQETAALSGVPLAIAASAQALDEALSAGGISLVIVDLGSKSFDPIAAIAAARALPGVRTVAFVSHVDEAARQKAIEAGCEEVMPKSAFTKELPRILRQGRQP